MGLAHPIASRLLHREGNALFRVSGASMQGFRPEMEDAEAIILSLPNHPNVAFFGVFDGHNGAAASKWSAQHVPQYLDRLDEFTPEKIQQALLQADADFLKTDTKHHGTTAVFCLIDTSANNGTNKPWKLIVGNIGDSRILLWRDNKTIALTKDHKPTNEAELARIRAAGGFVDWGRVDGQLALSRAIGDVAYKENKALPLEKQRVIALPDITIEEIREGDVLMVCCDGIFEAFSNEEAMSAMADLLSRETADPAEAVSAFLDLTLRKGSKDNMTAIAIQFMDGTGYAKEAQYVPGPFNRNMADRNFVDAYTRNARLHGYTLEQCLEINGEASPPSSSTPPVAEQSSDAPAAESGGLNLNYDTRADEADEGSDAKAAGSADSSSTPL